ncbi:MAG TPA: hypothetical protein VFK13_06540 [Gemmatimonadaceae bacterium]|nr:hypothetical protein [Gemmatimonadaceae bacterium]
MGAAPWAYRVAVLAHIAGVVVWMGAVAYYLLVLRPAFRMSGMERPATYPLMVAIKARLRRVVGAAIVVLVLSGLYLAHVRGLLARGASAAPRAAVFRWKMLVVGVLVATFLTALPLLARVRRPALRGRLFVAVHVFVLTAGAVAALLGVWLSR